MARTIANRTTGFLDNGTTLTHSGAPRTNGIVIVAHLQQFPAPNTTPIPISGGGETWTSLVAVQAQNGIRHSLWIAGATADTDFTCTFGPWTSNVAARSEIFEVSDTTLAEYVSISSLVFGTAPSGDGTIQLDYADPGGSVTGIELIIEAFQSSNAAAGGGTGFTSETLDSALTAGYADQNSSTGQGRYLAGLGSYKEYAAAADRPALTNVVNRDSAATVQGQASGYRLFFGNANPGQAGWGWHGESPRWQVVRGM